MQEKKHLKVSKFVIIFFGILLPFLFFFGLLKSPIYSSNATINLQGKIVRNDTGYEGLNVSAGSPACVVSGSANDTCDFRVRYYDAASAGTLLFTEEFSNVEIGQYKGVFNLSLGSDATPTAGSYASLDALIQGEDDVYVEIGFDPTGANSYTETFTRMSVQATAYAVRAKYADNATSASEVAFSGITSGTNTSAAMVVGAGASLDYTSTGTINASSLLSGTWASPGAIGGTTASTGAFTTLSASTSLTTPLVIGTSNTLTLRPTTNAVNAIRLANAAGTEVLSVDTTNSRVGIGTTTPSYLFHVNGGTGIVAQFSGRVIGGEAVNNDEFVTKGQVESGQTGMPSGTSGQTLRHDGSTWLANSFLYNNGTNIGIGTTSPSSLLGIQGNSSVALTGTVSVTNASTAVVGTGTSFTTELVVGDSIKIKNSVFTVSVITDNTNLTLDTAYTDVTESGLTAYTDTTLFSVLNANSESKVIVTKTGYMGVGTASPSAMLSVGATSQFRVDSSGNLTRIRDVAYSFPSAQGGADTVLTNDGAGNLTWGASASGGLWTDGGTFSYLTSLTDHLVLGSDTYTPIGTDTYATYIAGISSRPPFSYDMGAERLTLTGSNERAGLSVSTSHNSSSNWPVAEFRAESGSFGGLMMDIVQYGTGDFLSMKYGSTEAFRFERPMTFFMRPRDTAPSVSDNRLYNILDGGVNTLYWDGREIATGFVGSSLWTDAGLFTYLTSTTDDLVLGADNTAGSKFFFDVSEGRVGIGTDTPQASIDIAGATSTISNTTGDITITPTSATLVLSSDSAIFSFSSITGVKQITTGGNTDLALMPGGTGSVGIGTTDPTNILSLGNSSAQKFWIESSSLGVVGRALTVAAGGTVSGGTDIEGGNLILQSGLGTGTGASTISFQTGTTLTTGTTLQTMSTKMTILGSGNVGIGTTSPSAMLSVGSTSQFRVDSGGNITRIRDVAYSWPLTQGAASTVLTNDGSGNLTWGSVALKWNDIQDPDGNQSLSMGAYNTSWSWTTGLFSSEWSSNAGTNNLFSLTTGNITGTGALFNVQTGSTATINPMRVRAGSTEALAIDDDGNVGMGTTTPGTKLAVMGGNNIDPSFPDGLVGTRVSISVDDSPGYTVPSGKTLYITYAGFSTSNSSQTASIGGKYIAEGSKDFNLDSPLPVASGQTIKTSSSYATLWFMGFLVDSGVTPVALSVASSAYTVPSGKTLNISYIHAPWGTSTYSFYIGGKELFEYGKDLQFSQPLGLASGTTMNTDYSGATAYIFGYLTPNTGVGGADLAETFFIVNGGEPGDVVSIDPMSTDAFPAVSKTNKSYDNKLAGIITTKPGMVLEDETTRGSSKPKLGVALAGRVPTKVTTQGGVIKQGDPITSSSTVGFGMKATKQGAIVGKALEEFNPSQGKGEIIACPKGTPSNIVCGKIQTFVNVSWFDSPSSFSGINEIKNLQRQLNALEISQGEMLLEQRIASNQAKLEKQVNANKISLASIRDSGLMDILSLQNLNGSSTTALVTQTSIVPNVNNTHDLGTTDRRWRDIYAQGTINLGKKDNSGGIKYDTETKRLKFTNDGQNWITLGPPKKSVLLSAQYPGSVILDNTDVKGTMTTNSTDINNNSMNYYEWVSSKSNLNTNKIKIRYQIPSDFKQWGDGGITFKYATQSIDKEENKLDFYVYDQASEVPETISLDHVSTEEEKWESVEVLGLPFNKCNTPGDVCMFVIEMSSSKDYYTRVGDVEIRYERNL